MSATAVRDLGYWSRLPKSAGIWGQIAYLHVQPECPGVYANHENYKKAYLGEVPKSASGSVDPLRKFLKRLPPQWLTWSVEEIRRRGVDEYYAGKIPEDVSPFVDTLARFIVAIIGGFSLVVPMLVMRLDENLKKSLITVSVAVLLFSAVTSLMFKASNVETLAATAAYAAVLVVFVGTSS